MTYVCNPAILERAHGHWYLTADIETGPVSIAPDTLPALDAVELARKQVPINFRIEVRRGREP